MPRFTVPLLAGAAAMTLLVGMSPAIAEEVAPAATEAAEVGLPEGVELPASTELVTDADASLRTTSGEVSVLISNGSQSPIVQKLRTETQAHAEQLAAHLDELPGVVAAPTTSMRALSVANTEPMASDQWNLPMIGVPAAWRATQGAGVVVAVIDSGVDAKHPDLVGRVLPKIDLVGKPTPEPLQNGHGTRIAGIIAGGLNKIGIAGVAPSVSILPVSALDPAGYGDSSTVARAIIAAADAGARVINLSLGGPDKDPVLDKACAYAFQKGAVVVAAGGNSRLNGNRVQYPAASPNVIAVASVDRNGNPSVWSNTGHHIDIAAPGEAILAPYPGRRWNKESGTSFATPHVAGVAALVLSTNPRLTAGQAAHIVVSTARLGAHITGRTDQVGRGVVHADAAVAAARATSVKAPPAGARLRLMHVNATPEPARRGQPTSISVTVDARYPDDRWRPMTIRTPVRFEFKRSGHTRYREVAVVSSGADGRALMRTRATTSGHWRAKVRQSNGHWTVSATDYLKVLG